MSCNRQWDRVIIVVVLGTAACGCSRFIARGRSDVVFPRLDSAREQFYYAAQYDENTLVPRERSEERDERVRRIIAAYQTVLDHFPGDQLYAPLALASIGNCYFDKENYRRTIRIFKDAQERYPNYPFVHAEAQWKIGRSLERLGKIRQAKRHYKCCIDTFRHSKNDQILAIVALCSDRYFQPSVPERRGR
ncbi:hypothetical protein AMJ85_05960 [candidate division BRC1 bacterium SM23_51]|nr:MAG: hypothetical protein AMJ85_05960 [candidate division BRC1 bacterium SM23_51]